MRRFALQLGCAVLLVLAPLVTAARAQGPPGPPSAPAIEINTDCSITLRFTPGLNATTHAVIVSFNGIPLGTFDIGTLVAVRSPVIPAGNWIMAVVAINAFGSTQGGPTSFIHSCGGAPPPGGPPGTPTWIAAGATGNVVTLSWTNAAGAQGTDIEAIIQATGQVVPLSVGAGVSTFTVPGIPAGNFLVRIRNRNAFGVSPFTEYRLVVVGVVLGVGDLQVTLTWNQRVDMDLHIIEPNGAHVYYAARNGTTARLDFDNTTGFGPENIFVARGTALAGIYQVFIIHYSGGLPTTSTIAIVVNPGTSSERVALFTRSTPSGNTGLGYNVANVDVRNGTILETTGTRDERPSDQRPKTTEAAAAGGSR